MQLHFSNRARYYAKLHYRKNPEFYSQNALTALKIYVYQVVKILNASDEHVMALGANFSLQADSHLVCIQSEQGYKTQAINIQNQPRKGAVF